MVIEPVGDCPGCGDPVAMHNENGCHVYTDDHCCPCEQAYPITYTPVTEWLSL